MNDVILWCYTATDIDHAEFVSIMYVRHKTDCGLYKVTLDFEGQELNRLLVDLGYARAEADTTLFEQMLDDSSNLGKWRKYIYKISLDTYLYV